MTLPAGLNQSGWREAPGVVNGFRGRRSHVRPARPVTSLALDTRDHVRKVRLRRLCDVRGVAIEALSYFRRSGKPAGSLR